MKKKIVQPKDRIVNRFKIYPIRMRPDDREAVARLQKLYGLRTLAEAVRVADRVVLALEVPVEKVRELNAAYQEQNPGCLAITIPEPSH